MQVLLVRHALPLRSEHGEGSDPDLSGEGFAQVQTAEPVAAARELSVEIDDRFAEYDRDHPMYIPIEHIRDEMPEEWARLARGHLPSAVDEDAFRARVRAAVEDLVATADHADTVAVFTHGGVINALLHEILGTTRLLSFPVDYASVTRLLYSRSGEATVAGVNSTEHVWDLLPRNQRW